MTPEEMATDTQREAEDRNNEVRFRMCEDTWDRDMMMHEHLSRVNYMGEAVI